MPWRAGWAGPWGSTSEPLVIGVLFLVGMVLLPTLLVGAAAEGLGRSVGIGTHLVQEATRYAYALVPLGFGMWIAHYLFHFLVGGLTIIPLTQEYLAFLGFPSLGLPSWALGPLVPESWLLPVELLLPGVGPPGVPGGGLTGSPSERWGRGGRACPRRPSLGLSWPSFSPLPASGSFSSPWR